MIKLLILAELFLYIAISNCSYESKNKSVTKANEEVRRNRQGDLMVDWTKSYWNKVHLIEVICPRDNA